MVVEQVTCLRIVGGETGDPHSLRALQVGYRAGERGEKDDARQHVRRRLDRAGRAHPRPVVRFAVEQVAGERAGVCWWGPIVVARVHGGQRGHVDRQHRPVRVVGQRSGGTDAGGVGAEHGGEAVASGVEDGRPRPRVGGEFGELFGIGAYAELVQGVAQQVPPARAGSGQQQHPGGAAVADPAVLEQSEEVAARPAFRVVDDDEEPSACRM